MDPHIADWATKPCPEMTTYQLECDAVTYRAIRNTLLCVVK